MLQNMQKFNISVIFNHMFVLYKVISIFWLITNKTVFVIILSNKMSKGNCIVRIFNKKIL